MDTPSLVPRLARWGLGTRLGYTRKGTGNELVATPFAERGRMKGVAYECAGSHNNQATKSVNLPF